MPFSRCLSRPASASAADETQRIQRTERSARMEQAWNGAERGFPLVTSCTAVELDRPLAPNRDAYVLKSVVDGRGQDVSRRLLFRSLACAIVPGSVF